MVYLVVTESKKNKVKWSISLTHILFRIKFGISTLHIIKLKTKLQELTY